MSPLVDELRRIPLRYVLLAVGLSLVLLYLGLITPMQYGYFGNGQEAVRLFVQLGAFGVVLSAIAPLVALRWLWPAIGLAAAIPATLLLLGNTHQWSFAVFLALLAVAACAGWRQPRASWWAVAAAMCFPVLLMFAGTVVAPDGAESFIADYGLGYRLMTAGMYLVVALLGQAAAYGFRSAARRAAETAELADERRAVGNEAALLGERSRLARDLHDVVAHHVC